MNLLTFNLLCIGGLGRFSSGTWAESADSATLEAGDGETLGTGTGNRFSGSLDPYFVCGTEGR